MSKDILMPKIFEDVSAPTLELQIETFLRKEGLTQKDIAQIGYTVSKKSGEESSPMGYYSCIILYTPK